MKRSWTSRPCGRRSPRPRTPSWTPLKPVSPALADLKAGDKDAPGEIENALCAILGACEFQDLTGQRLTRVEAFMTGDGSLFKDPLAFGPARQGEGLDQGAADALFAEHFPVSS